MKARLRRYRPRLVVCTGRTGTNEFLRLFLGEDERTPFYRSEGDGFPRRRFELYRHEETNTVVALCNFLTNRRNTTLGYDDIAPIARKLREVEKLSWLQKLDSPVPWPEERPSCGLERSTFEASEEGGCAAQL